MASNTRTRKILHSVGRELKENPPRQLRKTARKFGKKRAQTQKVAILLSKARRRGAKISKGKR